MSSYKQKQKQNQKMARLEAKKRARSIKKAPKTAQQTLPFRTIFPDGICEIEKGYYSKTIAFNDVNYQTSKKEDKVSFFEAYCGFLNYFDTQIDVQITLINSFIDQKDLEKFIMIPLSGGALDKYCIEWNTMLRNQIQQGNNNIRKSRYLTFSIRADTEDRARKQLNLIELEVLKNFRENLKSSALSLNGIQRLELLHSIYRQGTSKKLDFDYSLVTKTGLTVKNFIAPNSFDFRASDEFKMGDVLGRASYLRVTASELTDEFLTDIMSLENNLIVTINLHSLKQQEAIKSVKHKLTMMESEKVGQQKNAVKQGYDMDLIPSDLKKSIKETEETLYDLQDRDQRMFQCTILFLNTSKDRERLDDDLFQLKAVAEKNNCDIEPLEEQQEDALASIVPVGVNRIDIKRTMTTETAAILIPFTTEELFQERGRYYGLNSLSHNMILIDRTTNNPNGIILGKPDSGKSFAVKRETISTLLSTEDGEDEIIIIDPDREYTKLGHAFGGEVIHISAGSNNHINPFDLNEYYSDGDDPLIMKSEFILSLCESLLGNKSGLSPKERSIIDRCVGFTYAKYLQNMDKNPIPTLKDFYETLKTQDDPEANGIAVALELYVEGSLRVFSQPTNVDLKKRFIIYDIKDLGKSLKTMGMLIVLDQIWNRVTKNRAAGRRTHVIIDEFHEILLNKFSSEFFLSVWKRFRKYGGVPTGITQNVEDLLLSDQARRIFSNSDFIMMLNQAPADRRELADILNLSEQQLSYITDTPSGHGLLYYRGALIPFVDQFPRDTELYRLMTTKLEEIKEYKKEELYKKSSLSA